MHGNQRSLAIAYTHVLRYFGEDISVESVEGMLSDNWQVLPGLSVTEVGEYGTYPYNSPSIVLFDNGSFHFVDTPTDRTILDSFDGQSKRMDIYSSPVAWATFDIAPHHATSETSPDRIYTVLQGGENSWDVGRKLGVSGKQLAEHNDIDDPLAVIPAGTELHLPTNLKKQKLQDIRIELKQSIMHVSNPDGAKRYAFGRHAKWTDISQSGRTIKFGQAIHVAALAHVPIEGTEAIFYLDSWALGDYAKKGAPKRPMGFGFNDLSEGEYTEPVVLPAVVTPVENTPTPIESPATQKIIDEPLVLDQNIFDDMQPEIDWKETYRAFPDGNRDYIIDLPQDRQHQAVRVRDHLEIRPEERRYHGDLVEISGTFTKDNVEYGRLLVDKNGRDAMGNFFGINMKLLKLDDEYYTEVEKEEKPKKMSKPEVAFSYFARGASTSLKPLFNKRIKITQRKQ